MRYADAQSLAAMSEYREDLREVVGVDHDAGADLLTALDIHQQVGEFVHGFLHMCGLHGLDDPRVYGMGEVHAFPVQAAGDLLFIGDEFLQRRVS